MAGIKRGRGKKKMRLLSEINEEIDRNSSAEKHSKFELPPELLAMVISRLTLRDNIRASLVCKSWLNPAISVRKADKPPWLMIFPKFGNSYEFYDPAQRKSFWLDLPELQGSRDCYAKDDWLLLCQPSTTIFFFHPYIREIIKLPDLNLLCGSVAFSAAPTSANCIVFAIVLDREISTCRPGETEWTTVSYQNGPMFNVSDWVKLVFHRGLFYCLNLPRQLGIYDPYEITWNVYSLPPENRPPNYFVDRWNIINVAVHNGDIFVVVTNSTEDPKIYKLDLTNKVWSKIETLGGMTLFANCLSSIARTDLLGTMRNRIYFSKVHYYGKHCISYSLDEGRYYPRKEWYDWEKEDIPQCVWIEPPENLSAFH